MLNADLAAAYTRAVEANDGATLAAVVQADAMDRAATALVALADALGPLTQLVPDVAQLIQNDLAADLFDKEP